MNESIVLEAHFIREQNDELDKMSKGNLQINISPGIWFIYVLICAI